jgi:hypothetical protein
VASSATSAGFRRHNPAIRTPQPTKTTTAIKIRPPMRTFLYQ